jgi:hypothetical protein
MKPYFKKAKFFFALTGIFCGFVADTLQIQAFEIDEATRKSLDDYLDAYIEKRQHDVTALHVPGKFNAEGFVQTEWEDGNNMGSDGSRITTTPFDSHDNTDRITEGNTFGNLGFTWEIDGTGVHMILEFGEYTAGLANSSGQLGADNSDIEVKNLYIDHDFGNGWKMSAGIQGVAADPRSFVMDDDQSALTLEYAASENLKFWGYVAETDTGTSRRRTDDQTFWGMNAEIKIKDFMLTPFWIHLKDRTTTNQDTVIDFEGLQIIWEITDKWTLEGQGIYNHGRTLETGAFSNLHTSLQGNLSDLKLSYAPDSLLTNLSAEWLHTSGGSSRSATTTENGRQSFFQSQDPQVSYLLNIVDSDGADDAPGTQKVAQVNLANPQGLNIVVLEANWKANDKINGYLRQGWITSDVGDSINGTGTKYIGRESDAGIEYTINDHLKLKLDYGYLHTGSFFDPHSDAYLFTSALRFDF